MRRLATEGRVAGEQLVSEAPKRINVRPVVGARIAGSLLGRHIGRRADPRARHSQRGGGPGVIARRVHRLGDPEIGDDRRAPRQEDVFRLDVAVRDARVVRIGQRPGDVAQNADRFADRQRAVLGDPLTQRQSVDERHRIVRELVRAAGGEERHDVRLLEPRDELDFAREAFRGQFGGKFGMQHLYHDAAAERDLRGEKDARHAAAAEFALEPVGVAKGARELILKRLGQPTAAKGVLKGTDSFGHRRSQR